MNDLMHLDSELVGHRELMAQIIHDAQGDRHAHALLLVGARGVGKATTAYTVTKQLLGDREDVLRRIHAGSHADFLLIHPLYDEKKEEYAREIVVEQIRELGRFLSTRAVEGGWRVVIIDGAESMNVQASNALLKVLEEPPEKTILVLVAHQLGRILPTIRSRCRTYKFAPLSPDEFTRVMLSHLPELDSQGLEVLAAISSHAPGEAIRLYKQEALMLYDHLSEMIQAWPEILPERILALADQVMTGAQHRNWRMFSTVMLHLLAERAKQEQSLFWAEKWQQASEQFTLCEARHLDYKSVIISFFHSLPYPQSFALAL